MVLFHNAEAVTVDVQLTGLDRTGSRDVLNQDKNGRNILLTPENYSTEDIQVKLERTIAIGIFFKQQSLMDDVKSAVDQLFPDWTSEVKSGESSNGSFFVQREKVDRPNGLAFLLSCMPE